MADDNSKTCPQCGQLLPLSSFGIRRSTKDGRASWCKPCCVRKVREYTRKRPDWRERKKAYDKDRIEANRERMSKQWRANYERNKERALGYAKQWAANNREKRRLISQSYKHRRRSVEREGMTWRELREWKAAQSKICHWCGVKCARGFVVDHIKPLAKGGKHEAHNLAISCRPCNAKKSARDPVEFAQSIGKLL